MFNLIDWLNTSEHPFAPYVLVMAILLFTIITIGSPIAIVVMLIQ